MSTQWDEDRKIIEGATGGPWRLDGAGSLVAPGDSPHQVRAIADLSTRTDSIEADAMFIAAARTRWPAALDALAAALERIAELEAALRAWDEWAAKAEAPLNAAAVMQSIHGGSYNVEPWPRDSAHRLLSQGIAVSGYEWPETEYVEINPERLSGQPAIRGTRIFAEHIARMAVDDGEDWSGIREDFDLTDEQIRGAIDWWTRLLSQDKPNG